MGIFFCGVESFSLDKRILRMEYMAVGKGERMSERCGLCGGSIKAGRCAQDAGVVCVNGERSGSKRACGGHDTKLGPDGFWDANGRDATVYPAGCGCAKRRPRGTEWTEPGQGATAENLRRAVHDAAIPGVESSKAILNLQTMYGRIGFDGPSRTNLRLTGQPLTSEDLKRIAECK